MSKILGLFEISQVLVVSNHCYQVLGSSKVMLPFLEHLDDCKEFPIIDVIVSLCGGEGGGMVGAGMEVPVGVLLHQYPS